MATAKTRITWPRAALVALALAALIGWAFRVPILGYARTGAAFGARTACACRYVAGRSLKGCRKDFEPGMGVVFLSDDSEGKSVTARVPLVASDTARFRPGYGCLLDPWDHGSVAEIQPPPSTRSPA